MGFGAVTAFAGGGLSVYGGIQSNRAAQKAKRQARRLAAANVAGLMALAVSDEKDAIRALRNFQWDAAIFRGAQLNKIQGDNLNASFGSAAAIIAQDAGQIARDAATIEDNMKRRTAETLHAADVARLGGESQASQLASRGLAALYSGISGGINIASSFYASRAPRSRKPKAKE